MIELTDLDPEDIADASANSKHVSDISQKWSVYLHGLAGDFAAEQLGQESMIASDIVHFLSEAFKSLSKTN